MGTIWINLLPNFVVTSLKRLSLIWHEILCPLLRLLACFPPLEHLFPRSGLRWWDLETLGLQRLDCPHFYNVANDMVLYVYCKTVHDELALEIVEEFTKLWWFLLFFFLLSAKSMAVIGYEICVHALFWDGCWIIGFFFFFSLVKDKWLRSNLFKQDNKV